MKKLGIICCLLFLSCSAPKSIVSEEKAKELKTLIVSKNFNIVSHTAMPMAGFSMQQLANTNLLGVGNTASSIDLTTNANYFKITNDLFSVSLPFYGESRFSSFSTNTSSIQFDGVPKNAAIDFDTSKKHYYLTYEFRKQNETFKISVEIYLNFKTRITVLSNKRSSITYLGVVQGV